MASFASAARLPGRRVARSATEGSTYRDLAPANVVREAQRGSALLVYGHLPAGQAVAAAVV